MESTCLLNWLISCLWFIICICFVGPKHTIPREYQSGDSSPNHDENTSNSSASRVQSGNNSPAGYNAVTSAPATSSTVTPAAEDCRYTQRILGTWNNQNLQTVSECHSAIGLMCAKVDSSRDSKYIRYFSGGPSKAQTDRSRRQKTLLN